jgi:hypothetical protein
MSAVERACLRLGVPFRALEALPVRWDTAS